MTAPTFPLPAGTTIPQGLILRLSLTAYEAETSSGQNIWVPFYGSRGVHEPAPASPLVVLS